MINILTRESVIGEKVYQLRDSTFGNFVYGTRPGLDENMRMPNPYATRGCARRLSGIAKSAPSNSADLLTPSVFSLWEIVFASEDPVPTIHPSGTFYLQGKIRICFGQTPELSGSGSKSGSGSGSGSGDQSLLQGHPTLLTVEHTKY